MPDAPDLPPRYAALARLTGPARQRAEPWRLLLGLALAGAVAFGLSRAVFALARLALPEPAFLDFTAEVEAAKTPSGLLVLLALMGTLGVGAIVATEIVHRRSGLTLIGPLRLAMSQFLRVTGAIVALTVAVALLPPWGLTSGLEPGLHPAPWLALLPLSLAAILVQTGSEELLFRGYLQTQLAARFARPAVWIGLPSALFALGHYAPGVYGENALLIALWAGVFGAAAADLTARAGTLGPAIGFHFANNVFALAVTAMQGEMSGLALTRLSFGPEDTAALRAMLPFDLAMIGLGWLAARLAIRA
jgi:membrane protease YdiL (CAAX protease family)